MGKNENDENEQWERCDKIMTSDVEWKTGEMTLKDYLALPEDRRVELIDGVFYDMASGTNVHGDIAEEIHARFREFIKKNGGKCKAKIMATDVQLDCDDKTIVVPDVYVVCDKKKLTIQRTVGAPDLVVEVLSPSNWKVDVFKKREKYERAGVREYWLVFPKQKKVRVHYFEKGETKEYTFADKVPVGIWNGRCEVDFAEIDAEIRRWFETEEML